MPNMTTEEWTDLLGEDTIARNREVARVIKAIEELAKIDTDFARNVINQISDNVMEPMWEDENECACGEGHICQSCKYENECSG